jgi:import inner membrane translocase subunit TIM22
MVNVLAGGWLGGFLMSVRNGPKSAALTGVGFSLFGAAIHAFMDREKPDEP